LELSARWSAGTGWRSIRPLPARHVPQRHPSRPRSHGTDGGESPMQHDDIVLDVRRVTKIFGGDRDRTLQLIAQGATKAEIQEQTGAVVGVRDASFTVRRGEFVVIVGLSGSGKSSLVRCLIRLVEPSSGQIFIDGQDITQLSDADLREVRRHKTAMVFQHYGLLPHKSVLENAAYGLKTRGVPTEEREQAARAAI